MSNLLKTMAAAAVAVLFVAILQGCPIPEIPGLAGLWLGAILHDGRPQTVFEDKDKIAIEGENVVAVEGEGLLVDFEGEFPFQGWPRLIETGNALVEANGFAQEVAASGPNNAFAPQDWWMVTEKAYTTLRDQSSSTQVAFADGKATLTTVQDITVNGERAKRTTTINFEMVTGGQVAGADVITLKPAAENPVKVTGTISGEKVDQAREDVFAKALEDYQAQLLEQFTETLIQLASENQAQIYWGEGEIPNVEVDTYAYLIEGKGKDMTLFLYRPTFNPEDNTYEGEPKEMYINNAFGLNGVYVK